MKQFLSDLLIPFSKQYHGHRWSSMLGIRMSWWAGGGGGGPGEAVC